MINREAITAALFEKIKVAGGFKKASRRLKHWDDCSPAECPALFLTQGAQASKQLKGLPTVWQMSFTINIYVRVGTDPNAVPQIQLNALLDAVESTFAPDPMTGFQTLDIPGVSHSWISGAIEQDEGVLGDLAVATIPIEILAV